MPRWFVTGAGGQLANAFARVLEGDVFLSREETLDIRDAEAVRTAVHEFAPDCVLHCAAYTNVDGAEADEDTAEAINVLGTRNVVRAVRGTHTTVVYFSTDYVFDGAKGAPYVETDRPNPLNAYGRTKLGGEQEVLGWIRGIVIRTSWLFSETGHNFVKTILAAARERAGTGEPLRVVDDQVGSPTYAGHLAAAVDEAAPRGAPAGPLPHGRERVLFVVRAGHGRSCSSPASRSRSSRSPPPRRGARRARPLFSALDSERPIPRLPHWAEGVAEAVDRLIPLG